MYRCPRCRTGLTLEKEPTGLAFTCPRGHGDALTVPVLRKRLARATVNALWQTARTTRRRSPVRCPSCEHTTAHVPLPRHAVRGPASPPDTPANAEAPPTPPAAVTDDVVVDACALCQVVWFDAGELGALPPAPPEPDETRPEIAPARAHRTSSRAPRERVEDDAAWTRTPWLVHALALLLLIGCLRAWTRPGSTAFDENPTARATSTDFAFRPVEWDRDHGATWVTSFFAPGPHVRRDGLPLFAWLVLYTVGVAIERHAGRLTLAALLLAGNAAACLTYLLAAPSGDVPLAGATPGVTAAVTWLALARPHIRMPVLRDDVDLRISARAFGVMWVFAVTAFAFLLQGSPWPWDALRPLALVGALVGVAGWAIGTLRAPRPDPA